MRFFSFKSAISQYIVKFVSFLFRLNSNNGKLEDLEAGGGSSQPVAKFTCAFCNVSQERGFEIVLRVRNINIDSLMCIKLTSAFVGRKCCCVPRPRSRCPSALASCSYTTRGSIFFFVSLLSLIEDDVALNSVKDLRASDIPLCQLSW